LNSTSTKFSVRSLASGSSGNAILFRTEATTVLVDCGIAFTTLKQYLLLEGIKVEDIDAIVLTHEHGDHARCAFRFASRYSIPIYATPGTIGAVPGLIGVASSRPVEYGQLVDVSDFTISLFPVPHDAAQPAGVVVTHKVLNKRVSLATDAGTITDRLKEELRGSDLVVLESNHDRHRLITGRYPPSLKHRIGGGRGHLSNAQCAELVTELAVEKPIFTLWLAHLSEAHNSPALALSHARAALAEASIRGVKVDVALRNRPSARWSPETNSVQLELAFA